MSSFDIPDDLIERMKGGKIVVLTGAGVSAESGIPTFRDAQTGLWEQYDPQDLATPEAFRANPKLVWDWYAWRRQLCAEKAPNAGHYALAEMERHAKEFLLVTQNVDGFHQAAGSQNVIEVHGNISRVKCFENNHRVEMVDDSAETPPRCPTCNSYLRPDVVWFGEGLNTVQLERAMLAAQHCDVLLSIGTSSLVYPAAYLPELTLDEGGEVVEINPHRTPLTRHADVVFKGNSGDVLPELVKAIWK